MIHGPGCPENCYLVTDFQNGSSTTLGDEGINSVHLSQGPHDSAMKRPYWMSENILEAEHVHHPASWTVAHMPCGCARQDREPQSKHGLCFIAPILLKTGIIKKSRYTVPYISGFSPIFQNNAIASVSGPLTKEKNRHCFSQRYITKDILM